MKNFSDLKTITLEKFNIYQRNLIGQDVYGSPTHLKVAMSDIFGGVELRFSKYIASHKLDEVSATYPRDWVEALKDRWFPMWLREIFPVRYTIVKLDAKVLYPKIKLPDETHSVVLFKHVHHRAEDET